MGHRPCDRGPLLVIVRTPIVALGADGRRLAIGAGTTVMVVDTRSGERETFETNVTADLLSVPVDASSGVAVASGDDLEITDGPRQRLKGHAVVVLQIASGLVVLTRSDSIGTHLGAYSTDDLAPLFEPVALGAVSVHTAEAATASMCLIGGVRGPRAWDGVGDKYLRAVRLSSEGVEVVWDGGAIGATARILAARHGTVVLDNGVGFAVGTADELVATSTTTGHTFAVDGSIGEFALSPSGRSFCLTAHGDRLATVHSGMVDGHEIFEHGTLASPTSSTHLAVDDDGRVVVAEVLSAREMTLSVAAPDSALDLVEHHVFAKSVVRSFADDESDVDD